MGDFYHDYGLNGSQGGDDSTGDGTPGNPWRTLGKVLSAANAGAGPASGDTVYRAGIGSEIVDLSGFPEVTYRDWDGVTVDKGGSVINTAVPISAGAWALQSGTTYVATIPAGLTVGNVVDRWASRVDAHGRHYGWLERGSDPGSGALAAAGQWWYDTSTGEIFVRLVDGANPATLTGEDRIQYVDDDSAPTWSVQDSLGVQVFGYGAGGVEVNTPGVPAGQIRHAYSSSSATRYCFAISGFGCVVQDMRFEGGENHAMLVGSGATEGAIVRNVDSWGLGRTDAASNFVSYSNALDVRSTYERCVARCYTMLGSTGAPMLRSRSWGSTLAEPYDQVGFFAHANPGLEVVDLLWDRCSVYGYGATLETHNRVTPFDAGNTPSPSDYKDWSAYPVRGNRCRAYRCSRMIQSGNIAHRRAFFDLTLARVNPDTSIIGYINANTTLFYESSVLAFNTDRGSSSRACFTFQAGSRLVLHHCTVIVHQSVNWYHDIFDCNSNTGAYGASSGFRVEAKNCIFCFLRPDGADLQENRLFVNDSGAPADNYDFDGCVFFNINGGSYSSDSSRNSAAEFTNASTGIDRHGLIVNPEFEDPDSLDELLVGKLASASPLLLPANKRLALAGAGRPSDGLGYLETQYDGTRGAWQAPAGNQERRPPFVRGMRGVRGRGRDN